MNWLQDLYAHNPASVQSFFAFKSQVLDAFNDYQIPVIELKKETSKEAVTANCSLVLWGCIESLGIACS